MITPVIGNLFIAHRQEISTAKDVIYLVKTVKTLVRACEGDSRVGILEIATKTTIGVSCTGIIEIANDND